MTATTAITLFVPVLVAFLTGGVGLKMIEIWAARRRAKRGERNLALIVQDETQVQEALREIKDVCGPALVRTYVKHVNNGARVFRRGALIKTTIRWEEPGPGRSRIAQNWKARPMAPSDLSKLRRLLADHQITAVTSEFGPGQLRNLHEAEGVEVEVT